MKNPKDGEYCKVYGTVTDKDGTPYYLLGAKCKIIDIGAEDEIIVREGNLEWVYIVHPKQCRRLVKKERKRVWVSFNPNGSLHSTALYPCHGYTEFVEVRKKK